MIAPNSATASINALRITMNERYSSGITSGGTFAGALKVAEEAEQGANILCMLPDTGERYLSTPLFAGIEADMNEEELAISRSTPSGQLGG